MISIIVILEVEPARLEEFLVAVQKQASLSRLESGCLRFEISRQLDNPHVFTLAELYKDQAAVDAHCATPNFAEWRQKVADGLVSKRTAVRGALLE